MPDGQSNPTEQEMSQLLGWTEADAFDEPDEGTPETPAPVGAVVTTQPIVPGQPTIQVPPAPPAPAAPSYEEFARQQAAETQRVASEQAVRDQINIRANTYMNQQIAVGMDEGLAREAARQQAVGELYRHEYEREVARNEGSDQRETARILSDRYGVPVNELAHYPNATAMEAAAARGQAQNQRLTSLEQQLKAANLAPVQNMDSGLGGGSVNSDLQLRMDYIAGKDIPDADARRLFG